MRAMGRAVGVPPYAVRMTSGTVPDARLGQKLTLSPSRAKDFKTCPLLYRFRAIDRLPESPTDAAARGTLVHAVLEELFRAAPQDRTEQEAVGSVGDVWQRLSAEDPELATAVGDSAEGRWLDQAAELVKSYFALEDPRAFTPESCESKLEVDLTGVDGTRPTPLKGVVDRIDVTASGEIRIVDYKTGRAPSEHHEIAALYQLKFYALMVYRMRGVVPGQLKLIYLGDSSTLTYRVDLAELITFQRGVVALWEAITAAVEAARFQPRRSAACGWCAHQALCPEFGGTPPPFPAVRSDGTIEFSASR